MEEKLRVAFLSRFVGTSDRGVETYVLELTKRLKSVFDVEILVGKDADNMGKIISGKYDVVIPTNGRMQSLKVFFGRMVSRYKVIIPGQAGVGRDDFWNIFVTQPDVYVALTDYEKEWAKKIVGKTKIIKIPNGVDLDKFKNNGDSYNFDLEKPIILSVGALEWYKHQDLAIKAVSKLEKGSLVLVGKGLQEKQLKDLGNNLMGEKRFKVLNVPFDDIPKLYRGADIFTLPSWIRESFGIVYVEAMASGLPIVAPDDAPRREIVGDAGVLTDVFDEDKYASAIQKTLGKKWGQIPREQAEKFNWDKIAEEYIKLIKSL